MNPVTPSADAPETLESVSLRRFFLAAVLWLSLAFFLWYVLRTVVVFPVTRVAGWVLTGWMPELFVSTAQHYETFIYTVAASVGSLGGLPGGTLAIDLDVNALMYCYGTAVLGGLVMATPLDWPRTFAQLFGGWLLLVPFQAFGLVGEALRDVALNLGVAVQAGLAGDGYAAVAGAAGQQALQSSQAVLAAHGLGQDAVAMWYQFGFLMLPPIAPVVVWILFNRRFIEGLQPLLAARRAEPAARRRGHSDA